MGFLWLDLLSCVKIYGLVLHTEQLLCYNGIDHT